MSLTSFGIGQSNTFFTFTFSILIPSSSITIPKNPTSLTFHLHFSSLIYRSFFANFFTTFTTTLSYSSSFSISTIMSTMKLLTASVLIKSQRILFIIIWNIIGDFVSQKNITVGSNDPSGVMNITFHLSPFIIESMGTNKVFAKLDL